MTSSPLRDAASEEPEDRVLPGHRIRVTLASGAAFVVQADNRDFVRWDKTAPRQKWGTAREVPFLFQTFLAWSAAKRTGVEGVTTFEAFQEEVLEATDLPADAGDAARPTR